MKERPIIFSGHMVRAVLAGTKVQTRRIVKLRDLGPSEAAGFKWDYRDKHGLWNSISHEDLLAKCPYGKPGDRLWVKETWQSLPCLKCDEGREGARCTCTDPPVFRADRNLVTGKEPILYEAMRWRPSIYMPRWASRITLEVSGVRVERLQDISEEDAAAEGIRRVCNRLGFMDLWDSINARRSGCSWEANPLVWRVEFRCLPLADSAPSSPDGGDEGAEGG